MKKALVLLLLISLGLNLGLGLTLWKGDRSSAPPVGPMEPREGPPAGGGPGRGGRFAGDFLEKKLNFLGENLGLDADQVEAFRRVHENSLPEFMAQAERVRAARMELRDAAGSPRAVDFRALIAAVGRQQARLDSLVTEVMFQELEILDDTQRGKYLGLMPVDRFEGRFGRRHEGRGQRPRHQ